MPWDTSRAGLTHQLIGFLFSNQLSLNSKTSTCRKKQLCGTIQCGACQCLQSSPWLSRKPASAVTISQLEARSPVPAGPCFLYLSLTGCRLHVKSSGPCACMFDRADRSKKIKTTTKNSTRHLKVLFQTSVREVHLMKTILVSSAGGVMEKKRKTGLFWIKRD